jgi:hypothetical protein
MILLQFEEKSQFLKVVYFVCLVSVFFCYVFIVSIFKSVDQWLSNKPIFLIL